MTDAFGVELELGDRIGTITGGRYNEVIKGEIIKFGKGQLKIIILFSDRSTAKPGEEKWVPAFRAMKVIK